MCNVFFLLLFFLQNAGLLQLEFYSYTLMKTALITKSRIKKRLRYLTEQSFFLLAQIFAGLPEAKRLVLDVHFLVMHRSRPFCEERPHESLQWSRSLSNH